MLFGCIHSSLWSTPQNLFLLVCRPESVWGYVVRLLFAVSETNYLFGFFWKIRGWSTIAELRGRISCIESSSECRSSDSDKTMPLSSLLTLWQTKSEIHLKDQRGTSILSIVPGHCSAARLLHRKTNNFTRFRRTFKIANPLIADLEIRTRSRWW